MIFIKIRKIRSENPEFFNMYSHGQNKSNADFVTFKCFFALVCQERKKKTFWYSQRNAVKNACCGLKNSMRIGGGEDNHFTLSLQPHS